MYPHSELIRLAAHKAALRRDIALHRDQCVMATTEIARPLAWLDQAMVLWRKSSPIAKLVAIPLVIIGSRTLRHRANFFGILLRWTPAVIGAARSWQHRQIRSV